MYNFRIEMYLKIIFFICTFSLLFAYLIEYVLGHQPCNLCLIERIPYGLSIILIIFNYIFKNHEKFILLLLIIIFVFSFAISFYHFGIEQNFFKESSICGVKNAAEITTKEEVLKQLQKKIISCKDVTFKILGFSLTTINILISLILIILITKLFKNYEKFEKKG